MHNRYLLDVFGGVGGVARHSRRYGVIAYVWDTVNGKRYDVSDRRSWRLLRRDIQSGVCAAVMLAPPCSTYSISRFPKVRDREQFIYGFPNLNEKDAAKVGNANSTTSFAAKIVRLCLRLHVPFVVENPQTSMIWNTPEFASIRQHESVSFDVLHQCAYGALWRKATGMLSGFLDQRDRCRISQRCHGGRGGWCSHQHKKHIQIVGSAKYRASAAYPDNLAKDLAYVLTTAMRRKYKRTV